MVARDINDHKKPFLVPELRYDGENNEKACLYRKEFGVKNQQIRKK